MAAHLSPLSETPPQTIVTATLRVDTRGIGFTEITGEARDFIDRAKSALERLAPEAAPWVHTIEGPDDMPAHVKAMLNGVSLHIPVREGALTLGTWQGLYLVEHRRAPHSREVIFQFIGSRR
jgi:secondary thiamine-phosphate synthase enzyme